MFRFPSSACGIKRNSSLSFPLKKKSPHCLSEFRPPPHQKKLSYVCSLRVSLALGFSTSPINVIFLCPWNTFVTGMLVVAESWTAPRYTLSYSAVCCNTYSREQVDFRLHTHCGGIFKSRLRNKSNSFNLAGKPVEKKTIVSILLTLSVRFLRPTGASCVHKRSMTLSGRIRC